MKGSFQKGKFKEQTIVFISKDLDQTWQLPCIFYSMIQNYSHEEP